MRLLKAELKALVKVLEDPNAYETPEQAAQAMADELDRLRGERTWHYACYLSAGIPGALGPYSTKGQAEKALAKFGAADKAWVVPGRTHEGLLSLLERLDKEPEEKGPEPGDKSFWRRAFEIRDGDAVGIVADSVQIVRLR